MPLSDIYSVIETELGKDARNLFETFDEEPLGSASLAQVRNCKPNHCSICSLKIELKLTNRFFWNRLMHFYNECLQAKMNNILL